MGNKLPAEGAPIVRHHVQTLTAEQVAAGLQLRAERRPDQEADRARYVFFLDRLDPPVLIHYLPFS